MSSIKQIDDLIKTANTNAAKAIGNAIEYAKALMHQADNARFGTPGYSWANSIPWEKMGRLDPRDKPGDISLPSLRGTAPIAPALSDLKAPSVGTVPVLSATAPKIVQPAAPSAYTPESLPDAPEISNIALPASPNAELPEVPAFSAFKLPEAPDFNLIAPFDEAAPGFDFEAPAPVLHYTEQQYESELKDAAETWLRKVIENGGTGLAREVEQGIWERGMAREVTAARRNLEEAIDEFAASGFPAPAGSLRARLDAIRNDLQDRAEDLSRKVAEDQANLAQKNTHFAIDKGLVFVTMELEHNHRVAERALRFAVATSEVAMSVFNARVAAFNGKIEAYKTKASVYEINVRAALQQLEQYRTLLEGKRIEATLRQQEVDLYRAQLAGVEALFGLYRTQLEGVRTQIDIDSNRVALYRARIEGQTAQINAKEAEYNLYRASQDGEMNKVKLYQAQVDAYSARVAAAARVFDMNKSKLDADVKIEELKMESFRSKTDAYRTQLDVYRTQVGALVDQYRAKSEIYRTEIARAESEYRLAIEQVKTDTQRALSNAEQYNLRQKLVAELTMSLHQVKAGAASNATSAMSSLAAAALSQINAIAASTSTYEED